MYMSFMEKILLERLVLYNSNIDKVDATMESIREQMELTNEISDAISNPVGMGQQASFGI